VTRVLQRALEEALGTQVTALEAIAGGDINDAFRATLRDGERVFVKTRAQAPHGMYACEARGLLWLRETQALRIPAVRAVHQDFLVLEWIEARPRCRDFEERFGRGLAALHRAGAASFGLAEDNFIGPLPQANAVRDSWADFYREQRLSPLLVRASARGLVDATLRKRFEQLFAGLAELVGPAEPPSRLHGDLWSGNVLADEHGHPVLIDPAVYGGQREVDLAMLRLFGAPSARFFAAYDEVYPRLSGHQTRVALYQLYPLLVHLCLFGASYRGQLERAVGHALTP
jgi:fructosamine-3-kinase